MDKGKLYSFIILSICIIVIVVSLPFLIKNGSYSAIFSAFIPIIILIIYFIFKAKGNNKNKD